MLPSGLRYEFESAVGESVVQVVPVSGGCIAEACRVETLANSFFLKWGEPPERCAAEAAGLFALREVSTELYVPNVLWQGPYDAEMHSALLLSWIEAGPECGAVWASLGRGLAQLHCHFAQQFGFADNNFIGRLPQRNTWHRMWPTFFRDERLLPQFERARHHGVWRPVWDSPADKMLHNLENWLPARPEASLVHGDLWRGNIISMKDGRAAIIDPAVYFGHREVDLAMTELFGGFDANFYDAYNETWPLAPGYAARRDVYNLYHLLNHLNHFGESYADSIESILFHFGS